LTQTLASYRFPQADTLSLIAAFLSLPPPENAPPLTLSPQRQKQKTQEALIAWDGRGSRAVSLERRTPAGVSKQKEELSHPVIEPLRD
jgi:hypothetical protein